MPGLPPTAFGAIRPENVDYRPFPAFPESALLAVLVGDPTRPGPFVIRVKVPGGVKLMRSRANTSCKSTP